MVKTLTIHHSGAYQIVHDDVVQASGDDPQVLAEPIRGVVSQRLSELRQLGHFEVHYEQREDISFTHLRPTDAPVVEVEHGISFAGFSTIHENASLLTPPPPVDFVEESYEGPSTEQDGGNSDDNGQIYA
jgi:hypothetical protein